VGSKVCDLQRQEPARDELVFEAHRLLYHSTLGLRVMKKKKNRFETLRCPDLGGWVGDYDEEGSGGARVCEELRVCEVLVTVHFLRPVLDALLV